MLRCPVISLWKFGSILCGCVGCVWNDSPSHSQCRQNNYLHGIIFSCLYLLLAACNEYIVYVRRYNVLLKKQNKVVTRE